jgi:hypothetical protein
MRPLSKERLKELEAEGKYVFHGSALKLDVLEPRQAYNYPDNSPEGKEPDHKPAVFASPLSEVAIFMAVVNVKNAPLGARAGFTLKTDGTIQFRTPPSTMEQIKNAKGYVYVFDKTKFTRRFEDEFVSYEKVRPLEIIEVTELDLPENIEVKEF